MVLAGRVVFLLLKRLKVVLVFWVLVVVVEAGVRRGARVRLRRVRIGDYQHELGIIDRRFAPPELAAEPGGVVIYWHVDDGAATLDRLVSLGARQLEAVTERGPGFVTASVADPSGNVLGIMYNRHYLDILGNCGGSAVGDPLRP
jgi:catechol 2,3-dioxygenase-like lactoylglutathione lyase family enzyme